MNTVQHKVGRYFILKSFIASSSNWALLCFRFRLMVTSIRTMRSFYYFKCPDNLPPQSSVQMYSNISPGWQFRVLQIESSVENLIALTLPVFRFDRFTFEIPILSANSLCASLKNYILTPHSQVGRKNCFGWTISLWITAVFSLSYFHLISLYSGSW